MGAGTEPADVARAIERSGLNVDDAMAVIHPTLGMAFAGRVLEELREQEAPGFEMGARANEKAPGKATKPTAKVKPQSYLHVEAFAVVDGETHNLGTWDGPSDEHEAGQRHLYTRTKGAWNVDADLSDRIGLIEGGSGAGEPVTRWAEAEAKRHKFAQADLIVRTRYDAKPRGTIDGPGDGVAAGKGDAETDKTKKPNQAKRPATAKTSTAKTPPATAASTSKQPTLTPEDLEVDTDSALGGIRTVGPPGGMSGGTEDGATEGILNGAKNGDLAGVEGSQGKRKGDGKTKGKHKDGSHGGKDGGARGGDLLSVKEIDVWYGQRGGKGEKGGVNASTLALVDWLTRGWWSKNMPSVALPEKVAVTFDLVTAMKDTVDFAILAATPLLSLSEFAETLGFKVKKGVKEGAEAASDVVIEGAEKATKEATEAVSEEAAEEVANKAAKSAGTTRKGVQRKNAQDWRKVRDSWDQVPEYRDILSPNNRALIAKGRTPVVDEQWVKYFPGDAPLIGEKISIHHIGGDALSVPLPKSRHIDSHMPGGFKKNSGGPGATGTLERDHYGNHA